MSKQSEWMKGLLAAEGLVRRDGFEQTRKSFGTNYGIEIYHCRISDLDNITEYYTGFSAYLSNYKERNDA
jgi:hypothetical protein